jgi:hypothetical protein
MRYIYQFILPLLAIAIVFKWISYRYLRMNQLRKNLESLYQQIETHLQTRDNVIPQFLNYLTSNNLTNTSIQQSIKSIEYVQNAPNCDFQSQQQTISYQLNNIFSQLENIETSKDARLLILQKQLTHADEEIQFAANAFNQAARSYNEYLNSTPVRFYASQLGFFEAELFELQPIS